ARATGVAFLAKTLRLHQSPLRIGDDKSIAQHTNLPFGRSESELNSNVNPESQQTLREATDIRNFFVHNRPYGQYIQELNGSVQEIDKTIGLYRYYRPFIQECGKTVDIFDLIVEHYKQAMALFRDAANFSGYNQNMITLTSENIRSIEINKIP
ncbi:hypothetical protein, partial [Profundibacter sp.]